MPFLKALALTLCLPRGWMVLARFKEGDTMSDPVGIAGDRIRSFVERIEQIENEIKDRTRPRARAST